MRELSQIRDAVVSALAAEGMAALDAYPDQRARRYGCPVAAVAVETAESRTVGFCNYLGEVFDTGAGAPRELYGKKLEAVISMPSGVFKPYAGVSTAILIFTKTEHGGTDQVWFYDMTADGYSLDDKRNEVKENDIPDIIARFRNLSAEADRKRTEQSFFVPKSEIVENAYDLSINKYKKVEYVPVEYPSTLEIMTQLREIEMEISQEMEELERLLNL